MCVFIYVSIVFLSCFQDYNKPLLRSIMINIYYIYMFFVFLLIASLLTCNHCAQTFDSTEEITIHRYSCDMTRRKETSNADISETKDRYYS